MGEPEERPALDLIATFDYLKEEEPEFYKRLQSETLTVSVFLGSEYFENARSEYSIWQGDNSIMHVRTGLAVEQLEREVESAIQTLRERGFSICYLPFREKRRHSVR